jgi:tetratricopeptide (TPR) repeat protein/transcriptional regulator with XRE-family HTH domain
MKEMAGGGAEFGRKLASFRLGRGLSQDELARRSGLSVRAIRDLERGQVEHPRRTTIALLSDALSIHGNDREAFENAAAGLPGLAGEHAGASRTSEAAVPRQLPPDITDFTGRELALQWLHARLEGRERQSTALVITAAVGKAGVGKTTLAVHAAHQMRSLFPDGHFYVNLRGVEAQALDPFDVLGRFLRALGVDGQSIPDDVDERGDLYRSLMADRHALVLLDNAADEAQIRPLIPAGAGNAVLVTSRTRLTGLTGTEVIDLDVLPPEQAVELLGKIAGADRITREPAAAQVIASLCGYLPLALRIAGARLAAKPHWRLQRMAHRLAEHQRRLDELTAGDLEVRASVGMSYDGLGETEQRAFRLLGLLEVPDFASWMLAALLDISAPDAEEVTDHLADAQLLDTIGEDATGQLRYRFHDLVRLYARERLLADETLATRRAALERTLQTYFERAWAAVRQLRLRPPELPGATAPTFPPDPQGELAASYQWLATEHTGLAVSLDQAWREGLGGIGQALTRLLADFFEVYACWDEWERTHEVAVRAARRAGDRHAEASLLRGLGDLRRFQKRLPEAVEFCTQSNAIFRELGDTGGEVDSLTGLGRTYRRQDRLADAASCFERSLDLCRGLDDPEREAKAMLFFAKVRRQQGRFEEALALLTSCREIFGSVNSCGYVAYSDLMIGIMYSERSEFDQATDYLEQALTFAKSLGDPRWEAYALLNLAVAAEGRGLRNEARRDLEQSLAMFQEAGDRQGTGNARRLIADLAQATVRRA